MLIRIEFNSLYLGSEFLRIAPIVGLSTPTGCFYIVILNLCGS